jgi:SPP1 gp7 family putative phage head morphogenesis protein
MTAFEWLSRLFGRRATDSGVSAPARSGSPLRGGRQTTPTNALATFGWATVPRRGAHAVDLSTVDVRRYTAQQLLDILADISPDVSLALWNELRLAGGEFTLTALRPDGSEPDEQAQTALDELVGRINGQRGGLQALVDQWLYTLYLQGAEAGELVLSDDTRDVADLIAVQPYTIDFQRDEAGVPRPYCKDKQGQAKALNEALFWYVPLDAPPDDPYGRAPAGPVIGEVMFNVQLLVDLKRAVHTNAWGRLDVSLMREMVQAAAEKAWPGNGARQAEWVEDQLGQLTTLYNSLQPDDTFIHWDSVKVSSVDSSGKTLQVAPLIRVLELRTIRALKQLPILMGSNEGTTETHGTVQFEIYAKGIAALRGKVDWMLERMLTTALGVLGVQATVEMEWEPLRTTDRLKDAQAEQTEIQNEANKVMWGWQTNAEAAMAVVGHEPVLEEIPRPVAAGPSDQNDPQRTARLVGPTLSDRRPVEAETGGGEGERKAQPTTRGGPSQSDGPDGVAQMTPAERRGLREMQAALTRYFTELGRAFPAKEIAQAALDGEEPSARGVRVDTDPAAERRMARIRRLVAEWWASQSGQATTAALLEVLHGHYVRLWNIEGQEGLRRLGIAGRFTLTNQAVIDNLRQFGAERVTGMDAETQRRLANTIANSLAEGNGVDEIARDIRREFGDMTRRRARLIAHTETGDQFSRAAHETYRRNGVESKEWLTAQDDLVEPECAGNEAEGAIPIDEPFSSGHQAPLAHPRCRCTLRPRVSESWMPPDDPWRGGD